VIRFEAFSSDFDSSFNDAACRRRQSRSLTGVACSQELPGLSARLDKLCYHHGGASLPPDKPHAFVYFITIHNASEHTVTLLGRKWVILHADGSRLVVEGDKIVGETPRLAPGEQFSYNSYHVTGCDARADGSFHGLDDLGRKVHVILPSFEMTVPDPIR
jgi:ApaG protein